MAEVTPGSTSSPTTTRGDRCPDCGQPLLMGVCGLCGPKRRPGDSTAERAVPNRAADRQQTLVAIAIALLVISLLASGYLIMKVSSLDSKLRDEANARRTAEDRISQLEGNFENLHDDQTAVHNQLDAQAAADPTAISVKVQPSVYTIQTAAGALGSGWVAAADHVKAKFVTNYHVIADAWETGDRHVVVYQDQGRPLDGTIVNALPDFDLAIVEVLADIPALKQSNETPRAGETIVVVGSPLGFGGSVSTGTVAALRQVEGLNYIQFSAPISPGNSGGPVVNSLGEVIGITELDFGRVVQGAENAKFAIPVTLVCAKFQVC